MLNKKHFVIQIGILFFILDFFTIVYPQTPQKSGVVLFPTLNSSLLKESHMQILSTNKNIKVNQDNTGEPQNEESIAINPSDTAELVIGYNDYQTDSARAGFAYSTNSGQTWTASELPSHIGGYLYQGDPGLAVDKNGNFYYSFISFTNNGAGATDGLYVAKMAAGGTTWSYPVVIDSAQYFEDKPYIAVDKNSGNVYVTWTRYNSTYIYFARSTDGGLTFNDLTKVSDQGNNQGSCPAVGPNGDLYVAWINYTNKEIMIDKSSNPGDPNGASFGTDIVVSSVTPISSLNLLSRVNSFPVCAVDPTNGDVYLAWDDNRYRESDILFTRSTDGGQTWLGVNGVPISQGGEPMNVANNKASGFINDQFFPWISVNSNGKVSISFYDRRNYPNNDSVDVYLAESVNGGKSFLNNIRINTEGFDLSSDPKEGGNFVGDYTGQASTFNKVIPTWTDTRNTDQDVYMSSYNDYQNSLLMLAYNNQSTYYAATSDNHNRTLADGNNLYETFSSGGEIFVRRSTDNGSTWDLTARISAGNGSNIKPSICVYPVVGSTDTVNVVWERDLGSNNYDIYYAMSGNSGASWSAPSEIVSSVSVSTYQLGGPQPVIAGIARGATSPPPAPSAPLSQAHYMHGILLVYTSNAGLYYKYDYFYPGWSWSSPSSISTSASSDFLWYPSLASDGGNSSTTATLTYSARFYQTVYSNYYDAPNDSWNTETVVHSGGTQSDSYDRQSCIAENGYIYDAWNSYNSNNGYYTVMFRQGVEPNSWENWTWTYPGTSANYFFPSICSYGSGTDVAITEYTSPGNTILLHKANISNQTWQTYTVGSNAEFSSLPNINIDAGDSSPVEVWTGTAVNNIYPISISSQNLPKQNNSRPTHFAVYKRTLSSKNLNIELSNIQAVTKQGQNINLPFKDFDYTKQADLTNPWQYMETGNINSLTGVSNVKFNYSINTVDHSKDSVRVKNFPKPVSLSNIMLDVYNGSQLVYKKNLSSTGTSINGTADISIPGETLVYLKPVFKLGGNDSTASSLLAAEKFTTINNEITPAVSSGSQVLASIPGKPKSFALGQNYPNPFNPATVISYSLPKAGHVTLKVYDIIGRQVAVLYSGNRQPGRYTVNFDASKLASGVYFYRLRAGNYVTTKKMILLK